jgi:transposase
METKKQYSTEVKQRAVRLVLDQQAKLGSQWAAVVSVAEKLGCAAQTLHRWVVLAECDEGKRPGLSRTEREQLREVERENRELKRANDIRRTASAYFAQAELNRRRK